MFWKFNVLTSHIDTLLDKEDVTLREVLDEDDVLQECKGQNQKLVQFLVRSEHIEELVNMVIQQPDDETDEKNKYKYPNIACEVLTSEVPQITEHLANEESLLNKVYAFLEREGPLNPLQASFFSKVMGLLIARKSQVMLEFLQGKEDFVGRLLQHLGTSAIMDMLLRLVTCMQSTECRLLCVQWLNEQKVVQKLVGMIDPAQPEEKHSNAALALCDMVTLSREHMSDMQERADPDPLLTSIESEEILKELLSHMLDGEKVESVLVNGLLIIQTLLEFRKIGPEGMHEQMTSLDAERLAQGVRNTLHSVIPRLTDLHNTLIQPAKQHYAPMSTSVGQLDPPLGNARLQLIRLLASLLLTNTPDLNTELAQLGTLNTILDLFFKYMWNNFLHTQVESCIATILNNPPHEVKEEEDGKLCHPLLTQLFTDCKIMQRILDAWEDNELQQKRPGGRRRGYMGHLTRIANTINEHRDKGPNAGRIKEIVQDFDEELREKWEAFISGNLADTNKQNTVDLVGGQLQSSSEDDDADFRDIPFPQDTAMQQAYSDYQTQPMTSSFIDQYGYKEDEFTEQEDRVDAPFSERISSIDFNITVEDNSTSASLFEQACSERMHQFEDQDDEDELWETRDLTSFKTTPSSTANTMPNATSGSGGARKPRRQVLGGNSDEDDVDSDEPTLSDEEEGDSDSEEDLQDSPRRVYQSPAVTIPTSSASAVESSAMAAAAAGAENMEVDTATAGEAEGFDEAMDSSSQGPIAMDTNPSPWNAEGESGENTTTEEEKPWANFHDIANTTGAAAATASSPAPQQAEAAGKQEEKEAATKMDDAPSEIVPEAKSSNEIFGMELEPATPDSSIDESSKPEDQKPAVEEKDKSLPSAPPSTPPNTPPSQPKSAWTEDQSVATSPPAEACGDNPENKDQDQDSDAKSDNSKEALSGVPKDSSQLEDYNDNEEDLADNFNFLSSSGMFGSEGGNAAAAQGVDDATDKDALEKLRKGAKEAMEEFTSTTTPTSPDSKSSNTENGPV